MKPFLDSTQVVNDGAELLRRIQRDGYLFIRGLLPVGELERLRIELLEIALAGGWVKTGTDLEEAIADLKGFCLEPEPRYMLVYHKMYKLQSFHLLQHHDRLVGLFERMLDEPVMVHPRVIGRTIFPQRESYTTPPHQDFIPIQGTPDTYSVWFPFTDLTPEMGGLQIAAGSHKSGVYNFRPALGAGGLQVTDPLGDNWVNSPFKQGDVLVFHCMTVHKGVPCKGSRLRMSMDARYQKRSEPIAADSLEPHIKPVTWDEVYADWPNDDFKYYWRPYNMTIKPYDSRYHDKRDRLALEMAAQGDVSARSALERIIARDSDPAKRSRARQLLEILDATEKRSAPSPSKEASTQFRRD